MTIEKEGCFAIWSCLVLQGFYFCYWWPWSCYKMVVITLITIKPLCLSQYMRLTYVCRQVLCCAFPSVSTRVYAVGGEDGVQVESKRIFFMVNVEFNNLWSFWIWWFVFPRSEPIMYLFLDLDWWWPVETSDSTTTCLPGCLPGGLTSYLDINSTISDLSFAGFQISEKNATQ